MNKVYKDFYITIEVGHETIRAFWFLNDECENIRRFSGYSVDEVFEVIEYEIDCYYEVTTC
jgi:hypothetical protein